jgi:hypothetical protein
MFLSLDRRVQMLDAANHQDLLSSEAEGHPEKHEQK